MVDEYGSENEKGGLFSGFFGGKRSRRSRGGHVAKQSNADEIQLELPEPLEPEVPESEVASTQPVTPAAESADARAADLASSAPAASSASVENGAQAAPAASDAAPADNAPAAEVPVDEVPVEEAPAEVAPTEAVSTEAVSAEAAPAEAVPAAQQVTPAEEAAATNEQTSAPQPAPTVTETAKPEATKPETAKPEATKPAAPAAPSFSPFSPFSDTASQVTVPAPVAAVGEATFALTFQAPDLPERDETEELAEEPPATETTRRRTRRREDRPHQSETRERERERERETTVIDVPAKVKGSTRLEAKKQRRNASRDAGRHRQSVTEVEFQARREAVDRQMIVRSTEDRIQIGVLEDGILVEHYAARSKDLSLIGNVYLGRVQNVLPSMEAAFVDIGRGRNAVLYSGEVDWDAADVSDKQRRIELALKPGDTVLVQVTKDPVGHKGARLTSQISLPGRYLVYVPGGGMNGISRKLPDSERIRLKKALKETLPENVGVIVRTAAEGATTEQIAHDVQRLQLQWEEIQRLRETSKAPALLHTEPNLLIKVVRDVFNEDITKLIVSGADAEETIDKYLHTIAPDLVDRVEHYHGDADIFDEYRVSEQLAKASERKVFLPSGGSLVIDRTEAMTVIDVNTGKFVGSGGNLEETVTKNNLEAAEEIVRQLRLRDLGGIVVVDFIDMVLESNRDLVLRRLVECLGRDRTKHQVAEVTSLGLVQMTRKKIGIGLAETFSQLADGAQAPQEQQPRSNGRKSRTKKVQQVKTVPKSVLNDEVKSAVAAIAKSTLGGAPEVIKAPVAAPAETQGALPEPVDAASASHPEPKAPAGQRARREAAAPAALAAGQAEPAGQAVARPAAQATAQAPAEAKPATERPEQPAARKPATQRPSAQSNAVTLDLPEAKQEEPAAVHHGSASDDLLADVLASLPEGNAPGSRKQERRRSRRATLPAGAALPVSTDGARPHPDGADTTEGRANQE